MTMNRDFKEGQKAEILVDEATQDFLDDPNNLFNLTLTKFPSSQTVFIGRLHLQKAQNGA